MNSYHPVISHYNRKNTLNRRYLDPELNETQIWKDYNEKHENPISYSTFCTYFKKKNLGFKKPGQDDCIVGLGLEEQEVITPAMRRPLEAFCAEESEPEQEGTAPCGRNETEHQTKQAHSCDVDTENGKAGEQRKHDALENVKYV